MMTISKAIKTALEFENKVYNNYLQAERNAKDPTVRKVFHTYAQEEKGHIPFLEYKLDELKKTGHVIAEALETSIPNKETTKSKGVKSLICTFRLCKLGSMRKVRLGAHFMNSKVWRLKT